MSETWTILNVLDWTASRFARAGIDSARLDAQVLIAHALSLTRISLYTNFDKPLRPEELAAVRELIRQRLAGRPVAYLVGEQEFWSLPFHVDEAVLIPRRDTEVVVEVVLDEIADRGARLRVADVATGSGALAVALARELGAATVVATDIAAGAVALCARNAARNGVSERVEVRIGDLYEALGGERFDVVVSNPPYVRTADLAGLAAEVRNEPVLALDGGSDGLAFYRRLAAGAAAHLEPEGLLAVEHGFDQADDVARLLTQGGLERVATRSDLAGHPRVTFGRRPRSSAA